jgi:DnaB-like helicase C terminal domain
METKTMTGSLQTNVLSLLLYSPEFSESIRNHIPDTLWSGDASFKFLLNSIYTYIDNYKTAPGIHITNLIEELTVSDDKKKLLAGMVAGCEKSFPDITPEYVREALDKFYKEATIEQVSLEMLSLCQQKQHDQALVIAHEKLNKPFQFFHPGDRILEYCSDLLNQSDQEEINNMVLLDIEPFDRYKIVPKRDQVYLFGGVQNAGKSFFLNYVGIQALRQGKKVVHVTLELGSAPVRDRYIRGLFGYGQFPSKENPVFGFSSGKVEGFVRPICKILSRKNPEVILETIENVEAEPFLQQNLLVKEFPSGSLTINELKAYLATLEIHNQFVPDVLIIDYVDLLKSTMGKSKRTDEELQWLCRQLRAIASEKHLIVVTASQLTREASRHMKDPETAGQSLSDYHIGQSYGKMAEVDTAVFYNQTEMMRQRGIAKLEVAKVREAPYIKVWVAQDYNTGQFNISCHEDTEGFRTLVKQKLADSKAGMPA